MKNTKKTWSKPELIVLVRGKPEEAVLAGCKLDFPTGVSPPGKWGPRITGITGHPCPLR